MMNEPDVKEASPTRLARRPVTTLGRRGLTWLFGLVLLCPIMVTLLLHFTLPTAHDQPLLLVAEIVSEGGTPSAVRLQNIGTVPLRHLRIDLNGAFAYCPQETLPVNEQLELPLGWFAKKTGQHLQPAQTEVRTIHVTARLPGNQRAVFEKMLPESLPALR